MGSLICDGPNACQVALGLDLGETEYIVARSSDRSSAQAIPVPKQFFKQLPAAKVVRVSQKAKDYHEKTLNVEVEPKVVYSLPKDFTVPPELCIDHEKGVPLNEENIKLFADYFLEDTIGYDVCRDSPDLKVWVKMGSDLAKNQAVVKTMYTLNGDIPLNFLIDVLRDIKNRTQWDDKLLECNVIQEYSPCFATYYTRIKVPWVQDRDFVEKMVVFEDGDEYYIYYSSIPNTYCPEKSGCTRGQTLYSVCRIWKTSGRIVVSTSTQKDMKATLSFFVTLSTIGNKVAESLEEFKKKLENKVRAYMKLRTRYTN